MDRQSPTAKFRSDPIISSKEDIAMKRKSAHTAESATSPAFRELSPKEMDALLNRNHVGRIAFSFRDAVDIRPIHYVAARGWLFGRTSPGDKLVTLRHNQWVAFEVDEIAGPFDWQSVVIRGTFYRLSTEGTEIDRKLYRRALRYVRKLAPEALAKNDPAPFRTELFGIALDSMTGRASSTKP
jgi:nitroimidazol reductase NimA-like FMN-containing flavoprotein (pyridoxamine 5'-phosphate oxidase superfamily)